MIKYGLTQFVTTHNFFNEIEDNVKYDLSPVSINISFARLTRFKKIKILHWII